MQNKTALSLLLATITIVVTIFLNGKSETNKKNKTLVVFIHGTLPYDGYRENPPYKSDKFKYHPFQPIAKKGLHLIDESKSNIPAIFASMYQTSLSQVSLDQTDHIFYTFGWEGKLKEKNRLASAHKLYVQLEAEISKYDNPKVILLTHSHGGNVGLSLARSEENFKRKLVIDKLVLLGTPVQSETRSFINSPVFKKIYNIYSHGDMIQVADIFSTYDFFSKRSFKKKKSDILPQNVVEIELQSNGVSPRHGELWVLGYAPIDFVYRKKFPLFPVPVVAFAPMLINNDIVNNADNVLVNIDRHGDTCKISFEDKASLDKAKKSKSIETFNGFNKLVERINKK